ncbi:hypothetical protein LTR53_005187 [Teratosphaeriaceae sp. CCFEE 6253]|nr:hypothetical protein LTR53_005187 [Teratosphaeriaceae sp. CCFEE 6253]
MASTWCITRVSSKNNAKYVESLAGLLFASRKRNINADPGAPRARTTRRLATTSTHPITPPSELVMCIVLHTGYRSCLLRHPAAELRAVERIPDALETLIGSRDYFAAREQANGQSGTSARRGPAADGDRLTADCVDPDTRPLTS